MRRRRGEQLAAALLDAAWDELVERGYAGFALESVARRAGTSTPVLYRRWPTKPRMIEAAIAHASAARAVETPDTGTLRGDLIAMMRAANDSRVDLLAATTVLLGSYFDETGTNPAQLREQMLRGRRSAAETMLQRAVSRGEVSAEVVTPRLASLPFDLFRHEVLMTHQPVGEDVITEIVDEFFMPLVTARR
ncbi:MAG: TetR/AcrR family transcriptional regulator [Pseudonocardia sp.]